MAIMRWNKTSVPDPFDEIDRLQEEVNQLFGLTFGPNSSGIFDRSGAPLVDLVEETDQLRLSRNSTFKTTLNLL